MGRRKGKRWHDEAALAVESVTRSPIYGRCVGPKKAPRRWFVDRIAADLVGLKVGQRAEKCTQCTGWHLTDLVKP